DDGLSIEVLDLRTVVPVDDAAIMRTVEKTNKVLIVHEDTRTGGVAGEIAARINEQAFAWRRTTCPCPMRRRSKTSCCRRQRISSRRRAGWRRTEENAWLGLMC